MTPRPRTKMSQTNPRDRAVVVLAALALAAGAAAPASAATPPAAKGTSFALTADQTGGKLLLNTAPGRALGGAVRVRNTSKIPVTVKLQAADIRNAGNGNADYVTTKPSQAGRWLHLSATTI